jgi:hypothetical protein
MLFVSYEIIIALPVLVTHAYKSSYLGGRDQGDCCSKPVQANTSQEPIWKKLITKKTWWSGLRPWVQAPVPQKIYKLLPGKMSRKFSLYFLLYSFGFKFLIHFLLIYRCYVTWMPINRWKNKENVVHAIHPCKEGNPAICDSMD